MRGEQVLDAAAALRKRGPSPRARGAGAADDDHRQRDGTIPACAGSGLAELGFCQRRRLSCTTFSEAGISRRCLNCPCSEPVSSPQGASGDHAGDTRASSQAAMGPCTPVHTISPRRRSNRRRTPRTLYREKFRCRLPGSLDEQHGPTRGVVQLPLPWGHPRCRGRGIGHDAGVVAVGTIPAGAGSSCASERCAGQRRTSKSGGQRVSRSPQL